MKFEIVCDSSADLSVKVLNELGVKMVSFYVSVDGENYLKEAKDIEVMDFYQAMLDKSNCYPKTSCPSIQDYADVFLPLAKEKRPILCLCLTQKFSGSYQSAVNARELILEEYPDAEIEVVDSQLITVLQGLFVKEAVHLREKGLSLDTSVELLKEIRNSGHIFFTTKDLKYLEHGGRLGKVASIAGSVLNLKPILHFYDGNLGTTQVCRGRKQSLTRVISNFTAYVEETGIDLSNYLIGTGIGVEIPEYQDFLNELELAFERLGSRPAVLVNEQIGATVGVHTGPYPMGLGILKKCDI